MEMVSRLFNKHGAQLVRDGKVSVATINEAVRRVLRIKFRLGLFEQPFADETRENGTLMNAEHLRAARLIAARSMVLLKNERETLPIKRMERGRQAIAVVGPLAEDKKNLIGSWSGDGRAEDAVTVLDGVRTRAGQDVRVIHARGCDIPCNTDEGFAEAVRAAREAVFTIVVVGESAEMSGEAASRSSLDLPGKQLELVQAIHATAKPYAVVLMNGRPLTINWLADNSPAILETWFAGTQAGNAIADVLFGDVNPSGKLPVTFPRNVGQIPIYYNYKTTGRPPDVNNKYTSKYLDVPVSPLYPFGFGLSYTQFRLSDLRLSARSIPASGRLTASVEVENTGQREGAEVVQLYLSDVAASRTRAVRELKGFERITLRPGEKRRVDFILTPEHLGFYNRELRFVVEPGAFKVFVGNSSVGGLEASFEVTGDAPLRNRRRPR
jgi:beta-glucosidase